MKTIVYSKQWLYALFLCIGGCILLTRTIIMLIQGNLQILVEWAAGLLLMEFIIDTGWVFTSVQWLISLKKSKIRLTLILAGVAIVLHSLRVLIFVMGRLGPWVDFDVRPEYRALHYTRWSWDGLYFAAIMSFLGLIGVIIVWRLRHRLKMIK